MLIYHRIKRFTLTLAALSSLLFVIQVDGKNVANEKDHNTTAMTADDQLKGSRNDVELTRRVREEITNRESLSTQAHNIKIITLNGVMTLRGPVKNMSEKNQIAKIAKSVASDIRNELEIAE